MGIHVPSRLKVAATSIWRCVRPQPERYDNVCNLLDNQSNTHRRQKLIEWTKLFYSDFNTRIVALVLDFEIILESQSWLLYVIDVKNMVCHNIQKGNCTVELILILILIFQLNKKHIVQICNWIVNNLIIPQNEIKLAKYTQIPITMQQKTTCSSFTWQVNNTNLFQIQLLLSDQWIQ